jgi:hypothetical protein
MLSRICALGRIRTCNLLIRNGPISAIYRDRPGDSLKHRELECSSIPFDHNWPPVTTTFHGLRMFGSHGGSHGSSRPGHTQPRVRRFHHRQKPPFGAPGCCNWGPSTGGSKYSSPVPAPAFSGEGRMAAVESPSGAPLLVKVAGARNKKQQLRATRLDLFTTARDWMKRCRSD